MHHPQPWRDQKKVDALCKQAQRNGKLNTIEPNHKLGNLDDM
jgi:hypothetical protein